MVYVVRGYVVEEFSDWVAMEDECGTRAEADELAHYWEAEDLVDYTTVGLENEE